jgi:2-methylisocitrate lyase-like PEP mutase family enzyme
LHELHHGDHVLTLANSWDVAGARIAEQAGVPAVATTSAGVAWSLGAADGDRLDRDSAIGLVSRVAAAVDVPVTADIETGFGQTPDDVAETVRLVLAAGAVGINIEDGAAPLRPLVEQADRIAAARQAAGDFPLFINARVDTFLRADGDPGETVRRATAYVEAGASGVFVPGTGDLAVLALLVREIPAPLNVLAGPGSPSVAQFAEIGVARVSLGSAVAEAAYAVVQRATHELLATGTYTALTDAIDYGELNKLLLGR